MPPSSSPSGHRCCHTLWACLLPALFAASSASADELDQLLSMSLEELANADIRITSAAKKPQALNEVPAAVYVISQEQIRRSGVRSVAEALALAPGVQVNKISAFNWQVSMRGLNEVLFNKLLVMIDGRSVFSPLMSGTYWHTIDTILEDIEHIEVIRGTAGTMWGGNAANGVINIITRNSHQTPGHFIEVAAGENQYQELSYRYGFSLNDHWAARFYAKGVKSDYYSDRDDAWQNLRGGFRADYDGSEREITLQAGGFETRSSHDWTVADFYRPSDSIFSPARLNVYHRGAYASVDWLEHGETTSYELHLWLDANETNEPSAEAEFYTFDLDTLAHHSLAAGHSLTLGGGARVIHRRTEPYPGDFLRQTEPWGRFSHDPRGTDVILNAYLQLDSQLTEKLTGLLGAKVEHFSINDATEFQPQARLLYHVSPQQQVWLGAGRGAVTPSFVDSKTDGYILGQVEVQNNATGAKTVHPMLISTTANPDMDTETVTTVDIGHRISPTAELAIDSTLFYSRFKNLRMLDDMAIQCVYGQCTDGTQLPHGMFVIGNSYSDTLDAESYGFETAVRWSPVPVFTLNTSYSYIRTKADCQGYSSCEPDADTGYRLNHGLQPAHYLSVQSLWDITPEWQLDLWYRYKSAVSTSNDFYRAPSVSTLDLRLAWQATPHSPQIELIVDALGKGHYRDLPTKAKLEDSITLRASWNLL